MLFNGLDRQHASFDCGQVDEFDFLRLGPHDGWITKGDPNGSTIYDRRA